ncbi:uncharacterized protein N7511_011410 [Penicillium nucicola]|uniref:uncharacterized protein n=1 Tax=Penicillium nucicola TaxID=1850975 RepID=UPI002545B2BA|nr:uncharacterized protein N7511_011410 [Penicillium nucicola]KAJ5742391.1 hypothetical protein N7511_011410 [Penicillium nucicola]
MPTAKWEMIHVHRIEIALEMISASTEPWAKQANNGVVIFALRRPRSRQVYLAGCHDLIQQLAGMGVRIEPRWIPAHQGVIGNEIVDQHAKEAAQEPEGPQNPLNRGICLAAAVKQRIRSGVGV